ncbi:MAG: hypothetical protein DME69_03790, partial [Verrucomicrobia bacterium]
TPRLVISVSVGLVFGPALPLFAAGEHPSLPQQQPLQQLPQGTTTSQQGSAQTMEVSSADISAGLKKYIDSYARKSADKKFHVRYRGKDLPLDLIKVHDDRLSSVGAGKYFACVDMKGTDGRIYDIDFLMALRPDKLNVTETFVHKINGKPLYNWKEQGGVWKRVRVS